MMLLRSRLSSERSDFGRAAARQIADQEEDGTQ